MGFSRYRNERRAFIEARIQNYDEEYQRKAAVALRRLNPPKRVRKEFIQLVGTHNEWIDLRKAKASDGRARTALRKRVLRAIVRLGKRQPDLDFIFGTIIHHPWVTTSDNAQLDLADMQQRTRNVINMCGFKGAIMMLEFQAEPGDRRTNCWPIHPNVHFIAWVDPGFDKREAGERVRQTSRLTPLENAKTFVLSGKMKAGPDLYRRACYLVKQPASGKKRHKITDRFEKTFQGMHPAACLRMTEILSYIGLSELLLLTGDATRLRWLLLRPLAATARGNKPWIGLPRSTARTWDTIRATDAHFYQPVSIKRTARRVDSKRRQRG